MFVQKTDTNKENTKQLIRQTGKFKTKKTSLWNWKAMNVESRTKHTLNGNTT